MPTTANLSTLLRYYATRQDSAFVNFRDFCDYAKKYAQHHVEEQADLVKYLGNPESVIKAEIDGLTEKKIVYFIDAPSTDKQVILVITYFSIKFAEKYKEISLNASIPFPVINDLPKQFPVDILEKENSADLIPKLMDKQDLKSPVLYCITQAHDVPALILPACVPVSILTEASMSKIRLMLKKEECHDYFLKKLRVANPGKEISTQNFFNSFITRPDSALQTLEKSGDAFYFWSQLCYFIRQDYEKVKDMTMEDFNILQSVSVSEVQMMYLKTKVQKQQQKEDALNELQSALGKPPYFFSMNAVIKLTDSHGVPLYGQFSEDDLKGFLKKLSTESEKSELPKLLVFKVDSGTRYFIYKTKVFPLVVRLCNEAHDIVEKNLTGEWFKVLQNYEKLPEMHNSQKFDDRLKLEVKSVSPVLYALLNANFLTLLEYEQLNETDGSKDFKLFVNGHLLPYSELLMLKASDILTNAKIMLPFWYTIPIISQIISFFHKKPKNTPVKQQKPAEKKPEETEQDGKVPLTRREALADAARKMEERFVPEGSTIDRELDSYCKQWNKMITKEANAQLTEDVNSLIRDYMRKVIKTISASTFTPERIQSLADTLVKTPNMMKITETDALYMYVQLYILRLVSNG